MVPRIDGAVRVNYFMFEVDFAQRRNTRVLALAIFEVNALYSPLGRRIIDRLLMG